MPKDFKQFQKERESIQDQDTNNCLFIVKPANAKGRIGIKIIDKNIQLNPNLSDVIIQKYITNPHVISGFRYDMRVYVLITCVDPLRVYLYDDG